MWTKLYFLRELGFTDAPCVPGDVANVDSGSMAAQGTIGVEILSSVAPARVRLALQSGGTPHT